MEFHALFEKAKPHPDNRYSFHYHCQTEFEWHQNRALLIAMLMDNSEAHFVSSSNGHFTVSVGDNWKIDYLTIVRPLPTMVTFSD